MLRIFNSFSHITRFFSENSLHCSDKSPVYPTITNEFSSHSLSNPQALKGIELVHGKWGDPFIVINKPSGIALYNSSIRVDNDSVASRLQAAGANSINNKESPIIFPHRLDKHTSGLLIVAFDKDVASSLGKSQMGEKSKWKKRYRAIATLPPCVSSIIPGESSDGDILSKPRNPCSGKIESRLFHNNFQEHPPLRCCMSSPWIMGDSLFGYQNPPPLESEKMKKLSNDSTTTVQDSSEIQPPRSSYLDIYSFPLGIESQPPHNQPSFLETLDDFFSKTQFHTDETPSPQINTKFKIKQQTDDTRVLFKQKKKLSKNLRNHPIFGSKGTRIRHKGMERASSDAVTHQYFYRSTPICQGHSKNIKLHTSTLTFISMMQQRSFFWQLPISGSTSHFIKPKSGDFLLGSPRIPWPNKQSPPLYQDIPSLDDSPLNDLIKTYHSIYIISGPGALFTKSPSRSWSTSRIFSTLRNSTRLLSRYSRLSTDSKIPRFSFHTISKETILYLNMIRWALIRKIHCPHIPQDPLSSKLLSLKPHPWISEVSLYSSIPPFAEFAGKLAITKATFKSLSWPFALYDVELLTGRTHQIRLHFAEQGTPLVGDIYYNPFAAHRYLQHHKNIQPFYGEQHSKPSESSSLLDPFPFDLQVTGMESGIESGMETTGTDTDFDIDKSRGMRGAPWSGQTAILPIKEKEKPLVIGSTEYSVPYYEDSDHFLHWKREKLDDIHSFFSNNKHYFSEDMSQKFQETSCSTNDLEDPGLGLQAYFLTFPNPVPGPDRVTEGVSPLDQIKCSLSVPVSWKKLYGFGRNT